MHFSRCQLPCSRLIASEDQHGKCVRCAGLAHARDTIFAISNCKYCENFTLETLRARLTVFDRESAVLPFRAAPEASFLREVAAWSSEARVGSFHFLSLHRLGVTSQIIRSSFLMVVLHPARRHGRPFPSGWRTFYIPRPPTLRTSGLHHSTFFPSSAAVEGKRHFRFSPLRVAAGYRLCTREKGRPALSPRVSIPCPHLYGLIRSCLHARGRCELSSASAGFMSLPSEVQSGDPTLVSSLIHFTLLPLSALLHTWRDLLGVSPWILRTIQFGYTLQFLVFNTRSSIYGKFKSPFTPKSVMNKPQTEGRVNPVCTVECRKRIFNTLQQ